MPAATTSSDTRPTVRIWSWRAVGRPPMIHSGRESHGARAARTWERAGAAAASLRAANGILSAPILSPIANLLSQKLAFLADDRQIDELRPGVIFWRIADVEAAQVHVHLLHRLDELVARKVAPRALEALDHHLRGEEPFHGAEVVVGVAGLGGEALVLLHHREAARPGERHHLRDRHAVAVF